MEFPDSAYFKSRNGEIMVASEDPELYLIPLSSKFDV
jgi:hypothetical protein